MQITPNSPNSLHEFIILPHALYNEIKERPEEEVSFTNYINERFMVPYTKANLPHEVIDAVKFDVTRNISKILGELQDETAYIFDKQIGDQPTWKVFPVYYSILQIVAGLSSRTFVGLPLCRDPEWVAANITFTIDVMRAVNAITAWHPFLRPIVSPFLPALRSLRAYRKLGSEKMKPQVMSIMQKLKTRTAEKLPIAGSHEEEGDFNLVRWIFNHYKDIDSITPTEVGRWQMMVSFAAIHTTTMALSHMLFDLAAHPQYIAELREEIEAVIEEENYPDRTLRKTGMSKLKKLDSFMKESQRLSPPGICMYHTLCHLGSVSRN